MWKHERRISPLFTPETVDYVCLDGEIITIPKAVQDWLDRIDAMRAEQRLAYCNEHDIDPDRWTGCYACEGMGYHRDNGLPCFCAYGAAIQKQQDAKADREFRDRLKYLTPPLGG